MKKIMLVLLALMLVVVAFAGCSTGSEEATATPEESTTQETSETASVETFRLAVALPDSGASMLAIMGNNVKALAEAAGGETVFEPISLEADAQISFVEAQISAGSDAILIPPAADSVLPSIMSMCEEAGVYWGICFRSILDDEIRATVEASTYYVGNCYENEVNTGYSIMKSLNEQGIQKIAIISTVKGDTTGDLREQGINEARKEFGMEIVAEARGLAQAADSASAAESFMAGHADLDCIFIVGTDATGSLSAVGKAIEDAGKIGEVMLACVDFDDGMQDLFDKGILVAAGGLSHWGYDPYMTAVKIINAVTGYPISETNFKTPMGMLILTDADSASNFSAKFGDENAEYYDADYVSSTLLKMNNLELDEETFNAIVVEFNPLQ